MSTTNKKQRKALSLNGETLRTLANNEIADVNGGAQPGLISWNGTCWSCKSCIMCV